MDSTVKDSGLIPKIERAWIEVLPDTDPDTSYLEQDEFEHRAKQYWNGDFSFVGVRACAEIRFETPQGGWIRGPIVTSGGLWGIESDSSEEYFKEVGTEEAHELADMLIALGLSPTRAGYARRMASTDLIYR